MDNPPVMLADNDEANADEATTMSGAAMEDRYVIL
jgi:hypothetical protein